MGIKELVKGALSKKVNKEYASLLAERQCCYQNWLDRQEELWHSASGPILLPIQRRW